MIGLIVALFSVLLPLAHLTLSRVPRTRARVVRLLLLYALVLDVGVIGLPLGFVPHVFFPDQTARSKPSPDPYVTAFAKLCAHTGRDLVPWRSVAIEDSKWGLVSARGADLRCVAVTNTYSEQELRADAELVVPGLHALTIAALDALCAD